MVAVHIVGAVVATIGLILFAADQWTAGQRGKDGSAGLKAWKVELGGPPALILIVIGLAVFLFPYWTGRDQTPATTITTTTTSTTTTTTILPPPVPEWWDVEFDDEYCADWLIYWDNTAADYWIVTVSALDELEEPIDGWVWETFDPFFCEWELDFEGVTHFWIWIQAANDTGISDFLWIDYLTE